MVMGLRWGTEGEQVLGRREGGGGVVSEGKCGMVSIILI